VNVWMYGPGALICVMETISWRKSAKQNRRGLGVEADSTIAMSKGKMAWVFRVRRLSGKRDVWKGCGWSDLLLTSIRSNQC